MSFFYYDKTWLELREYIKQDALVILPVGTTEEHGPHLPVETDTIIAEGFGKAIGEALEADGRIPFLVMRSVPYGYSMGCVQDFPGTISVNLETIEAYVRDIVFSLCRMGFTKIVILGCHGNHDGVLRNVMRRTVDAFGVYIGVASPGRFSDYDKLKKDPEGDIHAGESETSLVMKLRPETVHPELFDSIDRIQIDRSLLGPVSTWGLQETQMGSFGDPTYATSELGEAMLASGGKNTADWCVRYYEFFKNKPAQIPLHKTLCDQAAKRGAAAGEFARGREVNE